MESQITKDMNDVNLLLNPSPSTLLSAISKLQITERIQRPSPIKEEQQIRNGQCNMDGINRFPGILRKKEDTIHWRQIMIKYCFNTDMWCNLFNFACIIVVLMLYCHIVDFQWR
eukprot:TRINITY_DN4146_c0_g1_i1.p1 TRINITY_DN4146_c0_g1~~TRINITY_DN4146_c0_g1_i1.p1  ORF type:complete len:114 (-),score=24.96 TRINITY_DN4146_c0_g1_i1:352-693(-)